MCVLFTCIRASSSAVWKHAFLVEVFFAVCITRTGDFSFMGRGCGSSARAPIDDTQSTFSGVCTPQNRKVQPVRVSRDGVGRKENQFSGVTHVHFTTVRPLYKSDDYTSSGTEKICIFEVYVHQNVEVFRARMCTHSESEGGDLCIYTWSLLKVC